MDDGIWSMAVPASIVNENNLHRVKFVSKANVQKHQQQLSEDLKQAEDRLETYKRTGMDRGMDLSQLLTIIPAFVRRGQHKLAADFERKKLLLRWDAEDYRSIKAFHDLRPTEEQITSAKIIWQTTMKRQQ